MNMIAGIYYPDEGEIFVNGRRVEIRSPKDAYNLGIAMIHQHFKLVDVFTALENIALGLGQKGNNMTWRLSGRGPGRSVKNIALIWI